MSPTVTKSSKLRYLHHVHEDIYETTDIDYSVVLKALGYELVNIFVDHKDVIRKVEYF